MPAVKTPDHYFDSPVLELVQAALRHNVEAVRAATEENPPANPNFVGREQMTPLIYAVLSQNQDAIKILLKAGADATALVPQTGSAIGIAVRLEDTDALKTLLDNGVSAHSLQGKEPLSWDAARQQNRAALELLFGHGLSIEARNGRGETLLIDVLSVNDLDLADWLIDKGANVRVLDCFFVSAARFLSDAVQASAPNNPKLPHFLKLKAKFEERGVHFPVPSSPELKKRTGRPKLSVEEAAALNEQGEPAETHK